MNQGIRNTGVSHAFSICWMFAYVL